MLADVALLAGICPNISLYDNVAPPGWHVSASPESYIGMSAATSAHVADVRYFTPQSFFASAVSWKILVYMPVEDPTVQSSAATCVDAPNNDVV
jgi:hypothetical protein